MHIVSTGTQLCDKCGKPMANSRVANSQGTFHAECAGLGPFARIAELEAALGKALDYCDAATHGDEQYHDERSSLIRVYRGQ